jgi:hypothetical protein
LPRKPKATDPARLKIVATKSASALSVDIDFGSLEQALGARLDDDERAELNFALGFVIEGRRRGHIPNTKATRPRPLAKRPGRRKENADWEVLVEHLMAVYENATSRKATVSSAYEKIRTAEAIAPGGAFIRFASSLFKQIPNEIRPALTALPTLTKRVSRQRGKPQPWPMSKEELASKGRT